jgi:hypothetical protein
MYATQYRVFGSADHAIRNTNMNVGTLAVLVLMVVFRLYGSFMYL